MNSKKIPATPYEAPPPRLIESSSQKGHSHLFENDAGLGELFSHVKENEESLYVPIPQDILKSFSEKATLLSTQNNTNLAQNDSAGVSPPSLHSVMSKKVGFGALSLFLCAGGTALIALFTSKNGPSPHASRENLTSLPLQVAESDASSFAPFAPFALTDAQFVPSSPSGPSHQATVTAVPLPLQNALPSKTLSSEPSPHSTKQESLPPELLLQDASFSSGSETSIQDPKPSNSMPTEVSPLPHPKTKSNLEEETSLLERAQLLLARAPNEASKLLNEHEIKYPHSDLSSERKLMQIECMLHSGNASLQGSARAEIEAWLKRSPSGPYAVRLRELQKNF